jgi:DNA-binding Lrp family transcriptional regulator
MGDYITHETRVELDRKDMDIMDELCLDPRRPNSEIAENVGLSESMLNYRIKNLMKRGIIAGFVPLIRLDKIGLHHYRSMFRISKASREREEEIIQHLLNNKHVFRVAKTRWKWDLAVDFLAKDANSFFKMLKETTERFEKNLKNHELLTSAHFLFFKRDPANRQNPDEINMYGGTSQKEKLDQTDVKILRILSQNARATNHRIGKNTGLAPSTVKKRIKAMEEKGILQGYSMIKREWLFGGVCENVLIRFHEEADSEQRLYQFARSEPDVLFLSKTMAQTYSLDLGCRSREEFTELMRRLKDSFIDVSFEYDVLDTHEHIFNFNYYSLIDH